MKVTALLPDQIVDEVREFTHGKNITDSLLLALTDWLALQKIRALNRKVRQEPLAFKPEATAENLRALNRRR